MSFLFIAKRVGNSLEIEALIRIIYNFEINDDVIAFCASVPLETALGMYDHCLKSSTT